METEWRPPSCSGSRHLALYVSLESSVFFKKQHWYIGRQLSYVLLRNNALLTFSDEQKRKYLLLANIVLSHIIKGLFSYSKFECLCYTKLNTSEALKKPSSAKENATFKDLQRHVHLGRSFTKIHSCGNGNGLWWKVDTNWIRWFFS